MKLYYEKLARLKSYTDRVGSMYGTEDFAVYLYSIVKMTKPRSVLELGTGLGVVALWVALALQENGAGKKQTVDDGSEWSSFAEVKHLISEKYREEYSEFVRNLINGFDFNDQIQFHNEKARFDYSDQYDLVFSDFSHSPAFITKLLAEVLPRMSHNSFIFIDSASTYYQSYLTVEKIVDLLNQGKIPKTMLEVGDEQALRTIVTSCKFELTHIIENKDRNQNSTTQIKIVPIDFMPQPRNNIRF